MSIAVIKFPGTNCEEEAVRALKKYDDTHLVWHEELEEKYDRYFIPGGWSYGDHLRAGIIAANTDAMSIIKQESRKGKTILGVCNGFQILCESELLPGALLRNINLGFISKNVEIEIIDNCSFLSALTGKKLILPIAHGEGRYYHDKPQILVSNKQVVAKYTKNPNGSVLEIAGVSNEKGNVVGMMPHPERATLKILASTDGLKILEAFAYSDKK